MKSILLLLVSFSIVSNQSHAWDTTAAKFYPMSIGNVYVFNYNYLSFNCQFRELINSERVEITNFIRKDNGRWYFQFSGWWNINGENATSWKYQRVDSITMNVYAYDSSDNSERLVDSLLGSVNSLFKCERLYADPFGRYDRKDSGYFFNANRIKRELQCRGPVVGGAQYSLIEGIGFTGYSLCELGTGEEYQLRGCVIDGVVYGDTILTQVSSLGNMIPERFSLSQNYPNPFNPNTKINYSIPTTQFTILRVYDALGKEVATLVSEKQNAGSYEVEFSGEGLPSGIYFYKLQSGDFVETKRMILLK